MSALHPTDGARGGARKMTSSSQDRVQAIHSSPSIPARLLLLEGKSGRIDAHRTGIVTRSEFMSVDVGAKAPDFTLPNQDRENVTLSEQLKNGPAVLVFFPAAFSSVCQQEMCTFRDSMAELGKSSAKVLGISTDTFFAQKAWADQQKLNFSAAQ